jgi:hypothetical protein
MDAHLMAVTRYDGGAPPVHQYVGTSGDTKPETGVPAGSTFIESDTGWTFIWDGSAWGQILYPTTAE